MLNKTKVNSSSVKFIPMIGVWLVAAIAISASGVLYDSPRPVLAALIWSPVVVFLVSFIRFHSLRQAVLGLDIRWPILFHIVRVPIGVAFLVMAVTENLPSEFAAKAGPGDIVVGATSVIAITCVPWLSAIKFRTVLAWNALGLADILMVFVVAQRLMFFGDDPNALVELTRFPLLVVPMFVVPMVLITHFVVFAQLWRHRVAGGRGTIDTARLGARSTFAQP